MQESIKTQDDVFNIIFDKEDISWQSILQELVRTNQMDPWDLDISLLAKKYIEMLVKLKQLDFYLSGKVILAAAILLKIKSNRLVGEDISYLDSLFAMKDQQEDEYEGDLLDNIQNLAQQMDGQELKLIPRTPQARKRKVSIYELIDALQKAMEVKKRRVMRYMPVVDFEPPKKTRDISEIIHEVFARIKSYFTKNNKKLTFSQLVPSQGREDKIYTFIPLLHLTNARRIDLDQKEHFGEIYIDLLKNSNRRLK